MSKRVNAFRMLGITREAWKWRLKKNSWGILDYLEKVPGDNTWYFKEGWEGCKKYQATVEADKQNKREAQVLTKYASEFGVTPADIALSPIPGWLKAKRTGGM